MIRYNYVSGPTHPVPFVYVTLRTHDGSAELTHVPAQVDTGADNTVVPQSLADQLGILPVRQLPVRGLEGAVVVLPTILAQLGIHPLPPLVVEVLAAKDEPYVLLGRDILNRYRIILDGPGLALEIEQPEPPKAGA